MNRPARAWGWWEHLRAGGTTPWAAWSDPDGDVGTDAGPGSPFLPGAQQLELVRRLNLRVGPAAGGGPSPVSSPAHRRLVERVLVASAPGRGAPDLELVGVREEPRFGPRPVDPADLAPGELMRVASSLLAEDLVAARPVERPRPLRRPWARRYRLVGDPWVADALRADLVRHGRPPGGPEPTVLVLGADLPTMLAHAFTARSFDEGGPPWAEWLGRPVDQRALPPRADLLAMLAPWSEQARQTPGRVRLVLDPEAVAGLVGRRRPLDPAPALSAAAVDLARWVGPPLGLLVLPEERARLLREVLLPRVRDDRGPGLGLPESHREWALRRSARVRGDVLAAGYPVVGDTALLAPDEVPAGVTPDDADVLALALRLLLEGDRTEV